MKVWNGPCGDPTCYRGAEGSSFAGGAGRYKDGPCQALDCLWPWQYRDAVDGWITCKKFVADRAAQVGLQVRCLPMRPHYTDYPSHVIRVN